MGGCAINQGEIDQTPSQKAEQQQAIEENQAYWKVEAPTLAASLAEVAPAREAAEETQAAGQASAGARAQSHAGLFKANRNDVGAGSGSGADAATAGERFAQTAGSGAAATVGGRARAKGIYLNRVNAVGQAGQGLVQQGNSALDTGAKIQSGLYMQNVEGKAADQAAVSGLFSSIGSMGGASSLGSMGGGGGGGGAGAGAGGGGGGGGGG